MTSICRTCPWVRASDSLTLDQRKAAEADERFPCHEREGWACEGARRYGKAAREWAEHHNALTSNAESSKAAPAEHLAQPLEQESTMPETKTHSSKSNARRAALRHLGEGVPFELVQRDGRWAFKRVIESQAAKHSEPAPAPAAKATKGKAKAAKAESGGLPRKGTKRAIAANLLLRAKGCTAQDILDAVQWPAVSVPAIARAAHLNLRTEKEDGVTRYYGTPA